jgi:hypothetical protein
MVYDNSKVFDRDDRCIEIWSRVHRSALASNAAGGGLRREAQNVNSSKLVKLQACEKASRRSFLLLGDILAGQDPPKLRGEGRGRRGGKRTCRHSVVVAVHYWLLGS